MLGTFVLNDQTMTGNVAAGRLRSTLTTPYGRHRGCRYHPDHPWQKGEGDLVDDETAHCFASFRRQSEKKVIVLSAGRGDFLPSILTIATRA